MARRTLLGVPGSSGFTATRRDQILRTMRGMILKSETYHFHRLDLTRQAGFIVTIYDEDGLRLASTPPVPTPAQAFAEARKIVDNKVEAPIKIERTANRLIFRCAAASPEPTPGANWSPCADRRSHRPGHRARRFVEVYFSPLLHGGHHGLLRIRDWMVRGMAGEAKASKPLAWCQ